MLSLGAVRASTVFCGLSSRGESSLLALAKGPGEGVQWPGLVYALDPMMPGQILVVSLTESHCVLKNIFFLICCVKDPS